jgi:ABC-type dipeptide/oligopeptide/nickel transport system permease subunit
VELGTTAHFEGIVLGQTAITLGTALAAIIARMLRQSLIGVRESDYMRTAISKGLSERAALIRHGLRNALTSVITIIGLQMGSLLSGTLITEMIFSWPGLGRLLISAIGARDSRILLRHVLPNSMAPLLVLITLSMAAGVLAEAGLSFLGLGAQPPTPSWGQMLSVAQGYISLAPWLAYWPGLAIFLAVMGFNLIGDGVREALDPRLL